MRDGRRRPAGGGAARGMVDGPMVARDADRMDPARGPRAIVRAMASALALACAVALACDAAPRAPGRPDGPPGAADPALARIERVTGGAEPADPLPLVVAVHGVGDTPEGLAALYRDFPAPARIVLPRGPDPYRGGASWFPLPWDPGGRPPFVRGIERSAVRIAALLETLPAERPTLGRPILTGFSQGGILTFAVAAVRPDVVSAALPIAGWLPEELWPRAAPAGAAALPIRAIHGGDDPLLPAGPTRALVDALRARGFDAELRVYPGVGHTMTREMLRDYFAELGAAVRREAARGAASPGTTPAPRPGAGEAVAPPAPPAEG